jgi:hypothetical protein
MRVSLKKFTKHPYTLIKKAPLIIELDHKPAFVLMPYVVYKQKYLESTSEEASEFTSPTKKRNRLWLLLFG